jgi:hypothetical protein
LRIVVSWLKSVDNVGHSYGVWIQLLRHSCTILSWTYIDKCISISGDIQLCISVRIYFHSVDWTGTPMRLLVMFLKEKLELSVTPLSYGLLHRTIIGTYATMLFLTHLHVLVTSNNLINCFCCFTAVFKCSNIYYY